MAIISFDKDVLIPYIPEYANNRDSDKPTTVYTKFVSHSRTQHYSRLILARTRGIENDLNKSTKVLQAVQKEQFVDSVDRIENYFVLGVDGEAREVSDPGAFYETADADLITEVLKAMESQQKLTEGQLKN